MGEHDKLLKDSADLPFDCLDSFIEFLDHWAIRFFGFLRRASLKYSF